MVGTVGRTLLGTAVIFAIWVLATALVGGNGVLIRRLVSSRVRAVDDLFTSFWVGVAGLTLILVTWNFFAPIDALAFGSMVALGLVGLVLGAQDIRSAIQNRPPAPSRRDGALVLGACTGLCLWIANKALSHNDNWDSALYHTQIIEWANQFQLAPGVGNLFGPLGFTNAVLVFDSVFNTGPLAGMGSHLAHGLLIFVFTVQAGWAWWCLLSRKKAGVAPHTLFDGLTVVLPLSMVVLSNAAAALATDLSANVIFLAAVSTFLRLVSADPHAQHERMGDLSLVLTGAIAAKLSGAIFGGLLWGIAMWLVMKSARPSSKLRFAVATVGVPALGAIIIATRGVIATGYPMFPATILPFDVDWLVPAAHGRAEYAYIVHSTRGVAALASTGFNPDQLSNWLPVWTKKMFWPNNPFQFLIPATLAILFLAIQIASSLRAKSPPFIKAIGLALIPFSVAIAHWLSAAPAVRYVAFAFYVPAFVALWRLAAVHNPKHRAKLAGCLIVGALITPVLAASYRSIHAGQPLFSTMKSLLVKRAGDNTLFQPLRREQDLRTFVTNSGLKLNVPYLLGGRCYDAPLPCTPNPAPNLEAREPGNLAAGFRVRGEWAMMEWPYRWMPDYLEAIRSWRGEPGGKMVQWTPRASP